MTPTFVTWKWKQPGYRSTYNANNVHVLRNMIKRHYDKPHEFCVVTDDPDGIDKDIRVIPLWDDFRHLRNPSFNNGPNCYHRLRAFSAEAREIFGEKIVSMDLDMVVVKDIKPLVDRDEEFISWGDAMLRTTWYNGSFWMLRAGARTQVWTRFDPKTSPQEANRAGQRGSDQGWISYVLGKGEKTWNVADGVFSYRVHVVPHGGGLPAGARVVAFHGAIDPWSLSAQKLGWVRENYR